MAGASGLAINTPCPQGFPAGLCAVQSSRHLVAERTAELQEAVWRLEDFCAHVAHDLRDALGGIAGLAEIAHAALAERQDSGPALRSLPLIAQQAQRSGQMLRGLLRLAQEVSVCH